MNMIEKIEYIGTFTVYEHPGLSTDELRAIRQSGQGWADLFPCQRFENLLMAAQKIKMVDAVYTSIDRLVITNQTGSPIDTEASYGGVIYTTVPSDEFSRTSLQNPYIVTWNITSNTANGKWGSFVLIDSEGNMINRALSGVTKSAGTGKIVEFSGEVR